MNGANGDARGHLQQALYVLGSLIHKAALHLVCWMAEALVDQVAEPLVDQVAEAMGSYASEVLGSNEAGVLVTRVNKTLGRRMTEALRLWIIRQQRRL